MYRTSHTTAFADSEDATACPRPPHSVRLALVKHALDGLVSAHVVWKDENALSDTDIDKSARALAVFATPM